MEKSGLENLSLSWYNINYFGAQSEACLGHYEKALEVFKAMYAKQKKEINQSQLREFEARIEVIKKNREGS